MGADYSTEFEVGGSGLAQLPTDVARNILREVLEARLFNLNDVRQLVPTVPDRTFHDNCEFWETAASGKLRETMVVHLPKCDVSEWIPRSPGRAFWPDEEFVSRLPGADDDWEYRHELRRHLGWDERRREFSPAGKAVLVYGGIGTIRLQGRPVEGKRYHFLCATFSGRLHEGIPLILGDDLYSKVAAELGEHGCFQADITGTLRRPPQELLERLSFGKGVPMHTFIDVDELKVIGRCPTRLYATAAVSYTADRPLGTPRRGFLEEGSNHISWTFCTFDPSGGAPELAQAADWIMDYANRHTDGSPTLLSDFDEQCNHFRDVDVTLPLTDIIAGAIAHKRMAKALRDLGVHVDPAVISSLTLGALADASRGSQGKETKMDKIMLVTADPSDGARLRIQKEHREIEKELQMSVGRDAFTFEAHFAVRPSELSRALLRTRRPRFLHFSGHGTEHGSICLEDDMGETQEVSPDAIADLLGPVSSTLDCVLLNACYSRLQAESILKHVKYVIGMKEAISDDAAIAYSIGFYQAIFNGEGIPESHQMGCAQIRMVCEGEHTTPELLSRDNAAT